MIRLKLSNTTANEGINLHLPATPAEVGEAFSWFERIRGCLPDTSGERLNGIQEVSGSIPLISTKRTSERMSVFSAKSPEIILISGLFASISSLPAWHSRRCPHRCQVGR